MGDNNSRRPLKSRTTGWASGLTRALLATGITPNQISVLGVGFAAIGSWLMLVAANGQPLLFLLAALCIQLRLLCNMLDGLVAVEGGRGTATGPLFNELPDRVEDSLFLIAFGYALGWPWLGWLAALLAVTTAYVRAMGSALGHGDDFCGPMAKPHRMALLTLACFALAIEGQYQGSAVIGLWLFVALAVGTTATILRRTWRLRQKLVDAAG
ncbi:MAG: CDP-alcohol phosphatidyltransferase family protein [Pseudomonadota bacterium]